MFRFRQQARIIFLILDKNRDSMRICDVFMFPQVMRHAYNVKNTLTTFFTEG